MNDAPTVAVIEEVAAIIAQRRRDMPADSYVAECFRRGWPYIARKLIEEGDRSGDRRPRGIRPAAGQRDLRPVFLRPTYAGPARG